MPFFPGNGKIGNRSGGKNVLDEGREKMRRVGYICARAFFHIHALLVSFCSDPHPAYKTAIVPIRQKRFFLPSKIKLSFCLDGMSDFI